MEGQASHALTPRTPQEAVGLMMLHADMDPNQAFGGIKTLWNKPANHRHNRFYQRHDQRYDLARSGILKAQSSYYVDTDLLTECLEYDQSLLQQELVAAGSDPVKRLEAFVRHSEHVAEDHADNILCTQWGYFRWPDAAKQ